MEKLKKYKLIRRGSFLAIVAGLSTALFDVQKNENIPNYKKTDEDILYEQNLENLENNKEEIVFTNQELYEYLKEKISLKVITRESLNEITELKIDQTFTNQDFSDLNYFTNLEYLQISNNNMDLEDIYYNPNLKKLSIKNGNITNLPCIPNSVQNLTLENITITDGHLVIPYFTTSLIIENCSFEDVYFKNPELLYHLKLDKILFFDFSIFSNNSSLGNISITNCHNIQNSQILKFLPNLSKVFLDESSLCWIDKETLQAIPYSSFDNLLLRLETYQSIVKKIIPDNSINESEKINRILTFIKENIEVRKNEEVNEDVQDKIIFDVSFKQEENKEVKIYCTENSSTYLVYSLAKAAGIDSKIETNKDGKIVVNVEGVTIDVPASLEAEKKVYQIPEIAVSPKNVEEFSIGPLYPFYEKEYELVIKNLTQKNKNLLFAFESISILAFILSSSYAKKYKKYFYAFANEISDLKYDIKDGYSPKTVEDIMAETAARFTELKKRVPLKLNRKNQPSLQNWVKIREENFSLAKKRLTAEYSRSLLKGKQQTLLLQKKLKTRKTPNITLSRPVVQIPTRELNTSNFYSVLNTIQDIKDSRRKTAQIKKELFADFSATKLLYNQWKTSPLRLVRINNNMKNTSFINQIIESTKDTFVPSLPAVIVPNVIEAIKEQAREEVLAKQKVEVTAEEEPQIAANVEEKKQTRKRKQVATTKTKVVRKPRKKKEVAEKPQVEIEKALPAVIVPNVIEAIKEQARAQVLAERNKVIFIKPKEEKDTKYYVGMGMRKVGQALSVAKLASETSFPIKMTKPRTIWDILDKLTLLSEFANRLDIEANSITTEKSLPSVIFPNIIGLIMKKSWYLAEQQKNLTRIEENLKSQKDYIIKSNQIYTSNLEKIFKKDLPQKSGDKESSNVEELENQIIEPLQIKAEDNSEIVMESSAIEEIEEIKTATEEATPTLPQVLQKIEKRINVQKKYAELIIKTGNTMLRSNQTLSILNKTLENVETMIKEDELKAARALEEKANAEIVSNVIMSMMMIYYYFLNPPMESYTNSENQDIETTYMESDSSKKIVRLKGNASIEPLEIKMMKEKETSLLSLPMKDIIEIKNEINAISEEMTTENYALQTDIIEQTSEVLEVAIVEETPEILEIESQIATEALDTQSVASGDSTLEVTLLEIPPLQTDIAQETIEVLEEVEKETEIQTFALEEESGPIVQEPKLNDKDQKILEQMKKRAEKRRQLFAMLEESEKKENSTFQEDKGLKEKDNISISDNSYANVSKTSLSEKDQKILDQMKKRKEERRKILTRLKREQEVEFKEEEKIELIEDQSPQIEDNKMESKELSDKDKEIMKKMQEINNRAKEIMNRLSQLKDQELQYENTLSQSPRLTLHMNSRM